MGNFNGKQTFTLDEGDGKGYTFEAYVPPNVNSDTKIILYEHGDGEGYVYNWSPYVNEFNKGNVNEIVIHADRKHSTDLATYVAKEYNLGIENIIPVGFSGGGVYTCYSAADLAKKSNSSSPNLAVLLEGSCPYNYLDSMGDVDAYKKNNTVFLYFESQVGYPQTQYAKKMAEAGVNVLVFHDNYSTGHETINANFIPTGLMNFAAGKGDLPKNYIIKAYDKDKGWYEVDPSTLSDLNSVYNLFGLETGNVVELKNYTLADLSKLEDLTLRSDQKALESYLNKIRGAIRSTSISTAGLAGGFTSTTMMPSQVPEIVNRYVQSTTDYLSKLANETNQFAMIGESIKEMDFNLERVAKEIRDIELARAVYGDNGTDKQSNGEEEKLELSDTDLRTDNGSNKDVVEEPKLDNGNVGDNGNNGNNGNFGNNDNNGNPENKDNNENPENNGNNGNPLVPPVVATPDKNGGPTIVLPDKNSEKSELYKFNKYEEVVTNTERLVIESNKGYKIVIHNDGNVINGVEHYYDFGSESKATSMLNQLKAEYEGKQFFEEIIQDGQYIKVIINSDVYKGYSISNLKELYSGVEGYTQV